MRDLDRLLDIVSQSKNALLEEWKKGEFFKDKNNLLDKGIYAEGAGLCSILLLLVAFRNEEKVFSNNDKKDITNLINRSINAIYEWAQQGFGAEPILDSRVAEFFDSELGYTDTASWCLSSTILARYAERMGVYNPDKTTKEKIFSLLKKSLISILNSQHDDGTWGFATDKKAKKSLYYTYIIASTIADFFDYVLGEIEQVEELNEQAVSAKDLELIEYLNEELGDIEEQLLVARKKLQRFLVFDCLPLLPNIADCQSLSVDRCMKLGFDIHDPISVDEWNSKCFHHLYYAYYLLEMMITSAADTYFNELVQDETSVIELKNYYRDHLLMPKNELKYYSSLDNFKTLFTSYYEQALHASRVQYMNAKRTGALFWDSSKSELPIKWRHESEEIEDNAKLALDQSVRKDYVTDPTILPMSLRANIMYSYYVTEQPDITVDRLFEDICDNMATAASGSKCVANLWDTLFYSLPVTERSIEALIDYYDYLVKFEENDDEKHPVKEVISEKVATVTAEKSDLELAIEKKISEYLTSEAGQAIISASVNQVPMGTAHTLNSFTNEDIIDKIEMLTKDVRGTYELNKDGADYERLVAAMVELSQAIDFCKFKLKLAEGIEKSGSTAEYEHRLTDHSKLLLQRIDQLLIALEKDLAENKCELTRLYELIKTL